ncbi:MAG: ribulose-phosphate 3-epimerase [Candidatus Omnitrophica bacterium]|nr:ribulose-phosphate 3-epimerase [Candidatus Omnitrophota bacterium]
MIIPALLTKNKDELQSMINTCSAFTDYVQIDIMDGKFVPSESVSLSTVKDLIIPVRSEAHLMVTDPLEWLDVFKKLGSEKIVFHYEIKKDHKDIITRIKDVGLKAGLAVNPLTKINKFKPLLGFVDSVLFLSVNPGFYGADFIPEVLDKIKDFKRLYPEIEAGVDGGIKPDNAVLAKRAGADFICVGSAILKSRDPAQAYRNLLKSINEQVS